MNDLFDAGITDDKLALIYKLNSTNQVAVKTPFGLTERRTVDRIVLQGEVFGPLECSVSIDTFGKECIEEDGANDDAHKADDSKHRNGELR